MSGLRKTIFAVAAVALTVGLLWFTNRAVTPKEATLADTQAEAQAGGYRLITTQEVHDRYLADPQGILLVDTRQEWEYRSGHIKGARNFPMEPTAWSRWRKQGALEAFLGPDKNRFLVFY
ncbi:MAG: rhodanese-like domain-containing protein [Deltaproteobacteria bacterium]|nr:rhodanese-like domain-containing protein [Deltaproteobacteria bacterium]